METLDVLSQNSEFVAGAYNATPVMMMLLCIVLVDTALKGWGMWRAARMEQKWWFVALLIVNSMGILPVIYLLTTNTKYKESLKKEES